MMTLMKKIVSFFEKEKEIGVRSKENLNLFCSKFDHLPDYDDDGEDYGITGGDLFLEIQDMWDEIGDNKETRDKAVKVIIDGCACAFRSLRDASRENEKLYSENLKRIEDDCKKLCTVLGEPEVDNSVGTVNDRISNAQNLLLTLMGKEIGFKAKFEELVSKLRVLGFEGPNSSIEFTIEEFNRLNLELEKLPKHKAEVITCRKAIEAEWLLLGSPAREVLDGCSLEQLKEINASLKKESKEKRLQFDNLRKNLMSLWDYVGKPRVKFLLEENAPAFLHHSNTLLIEAEFKATLKSWINLKTHVVKEITESDDVELDMKKTITEYYRQIEDWDPNDGSLQKVLTYLDNSIEKATSGSN